MRLSRAGGPQSRETMALLLSPCGKRRTLGNGPPSQSQCRSALSPPITAQIRAHPPPIAVQVSTRPGKLPRPWLISGHVWKQRPPFHILTHPGPVTFHQSPPLSTTLPLTFPRSPRVPLSPLALSPSLHCLFPLSHPSPLSHSPSHHLPLLCVTLSFSPFLL